MHPRQIRGPLSGLIIGAILLTVIQPPWGWSVLAWISIAPIALACITAKKTARLLFLAYTVGTVYWLVNLTWLIPCSPPGWAALGLYLAIIWPLLALALRFCHQRRIPMFVACAILFVGAERLQGVPLGGFFWRYLCHSQFQNIRLIQIADIFGGAGVSFLIAMVNGLLVDLYLGLKQKRLYTTQTIVACLFTGTALSGTLLYGQWRLSQAEDAITPGPRVAAVQSNVPQSIKDSPLASEEIFAELLELSECAAQAGADLIAWPETMIQTIMDPKIQVFLESEAEWREYDLALRKHVKDRFHLLIGAYGGHIQSLGNGEASLERYNSAFMYSPEAVQYPDRYDKIHLVLFGETMPFRKKHRWLYRLLMTLSPYDYDYSIDAGSTYTVFPMAQPDAQASSSPYRFGTVICYEDTIPHIARSFALDDQGDKQIDWLVNISNDGWFVRFDDSARVTPSAELAQHAAACVFRAVENRLAILRSVNTGISCLIDSMGRLRNDYMAASPNWPKTALNRQGMTGWFVDRMPIDKRISFYTKHGQWLDNGCATGLVILLVFMLIFQKKRRKACVEDKDETSSWDNRTVSP
jgi:apolipoprotein N-acyltransferase